jgi:catecholate siderophore receptor
MALFNSRVGLLTAVLLSLTPWSLEAQETAAEEEVPAARYEDVLFVSEELPGVPASNALATKLPLPLLRTPASVGIVSEELLIEQNDRVLGDALRNVSGLHVQTQSGVADLFVVRGFDSISSGLVLTDGAAEPEISFYQLYNVERVEVLKGPGGFLYGATPTAATVNLVRKQPLPGGSFLGAGATAGSFGTYEGHLDWNASGDDGKLGFRLNGLYRRSDGFRDGRESEIGAANPSFSWRPDERSALNLNLEYVDSSYAPDAGLPLVFGEIPDVPRERSYDAPFSFSDQQLGRFQADYQRQQSERLILRNKAYYRDLDWNTDGTIPAAVLPEGFPFGDPAAPLVLFRVLTQLDDRQRFAGDQLEAVFTATAGNVRHQLLAGVEVAQQTDEFELFVQNLDPIRVFDPVETSQPPTVTPLPTQAADARTRQLSGYLLDQIAFGDRWQVVAGGRLDSLDYDDPVSSTSRSDTLFAPLLGVVYASSAQVSLYAQGSRAFAPPSSRVVGEREPEESNQIEAGVKGNFLGGRLQSTVAVYQLERENVAIPDDNGFTQQLGSQRSRGFEIDLAAEPLPRLRTLFSYAFADAELTRFSERIQVGLFPPIFFTLDRSGNEPAFAPKHLANLWLSRQFGGGFGVAGGARYTSSQFIAEDNAFEIDSALTFDAALSWERGSQRWSLNLKNLSDEEYETRGFGGASVIPAEGFSVTGGFTYRTGL